MSSSPLLALPGELRNQIWALALCQNDALTLNGSGGERDEIRSLDKVALGYAQALTRTCKQIRAEADTRLFYSVNTFCLRAHISSANNILRHQLWPRFEAANATGPATLYFIPTTPPEQFDYHTSKVLRWMSRDWLSRLSNSLCAFQQSYPKATVKMLVPIELDEDGYTYNYRWEVEVDFKDPEGSINAAVIELIELRNQGTVGPVTAEFVRRALQGWSREGFKRSASRDPPSTCLMDSPV